MAFPTLQRCVVVMLEQRAGDPQRFEALGERGRIGANLEPVAVLVVAEVAVRANALRILRPLSRVPMAAATVSRAFGDLRVEPDARDVLAVVERQLGLLERTVR